MGLDFINPKYLQKNSDAPSFLKPKQKYQTQEEIDKVAPVTDISKLTVHAATPSDNAKETILPQPILPKVAPNTNIDYESIYKQHADPLDKAFDFIGNAVGAKDWLSKMHTNIAKDILTEQQKKQEAQELAKSKTSNDAGLAPLNWLYNTPIGSRVSSSMGGVNADGSPIVPVGDAGKIGNFVGNVAGSILNMKAMDGGGNAISSGFGTAEKAIDNLLLKNSGKGLESASKLAQYATKAGSNAGEMGYFGGIQGGLEGDAKQGALNGALTGFLFGASSKALGDLVKIPGFVKDVKNAGYNQAIESKLGKIDNPIIRNANKIDGTFKQEGSLVPREGLFQLPAPRGVNVLPTDNSVIPLGGYKDEFLPVSKVKKTRLQADLPIESRNFNNVGEQNIKSIQYNHQELKPYIRQEAELLKGELSNGQSGGTLQTRNEQGIIDGGLRQQRIMSDSISTIKDITGKSYTDISKALDDLVLDHGRENNALAKRVELIIDDRLSNGYEEPYLGEVIPPNIKYLNAKEQITNQPLYKNEFEATTRNQQLRVDPLKDGNIITTPLTQIQLDKTAQRLAKKTGRPLEEIKTELKAQNSTIENKGVLPQYAKENPWEVPQETVNTEVKQTSNSGLKDKTTKDNIQSNPIEGYDIDNWKDKGKFALNRETMERNLQDIAGKDAPKLIKDYIDPIKTSEATSIREKNTMRDTVKTFGVKAGSYESSLMQKYGEGIISLDELKEKTSNWKNVKAGADYMRKTYDELIDKANESLTRNNMKPIPKRSNYMPHQGEMDSIMKTLGLETYDLPTDINGITAQFKPNKNWFGNALQRKGNQTVYDAVRGFDNYIEGVQRIIHHTDNIVRLRKLDKAIRGKFEDTGSTHLSNFVSSLTDYTNTLAGKKSELDRGFENTFGRPIYRVADGVRKQVASNMIGANVSSALTNFIPLTQSLATTDKSSFIKAMTDTIGSRLADDGFANKSDFLTRRGGSDKLALNSWQKVQSGANWIFKVVDNFVGETITRAKYYEGLKKGMPEEQAMKYADNWSGKIMADRSIGMTPALMNSKVISLFAPFQTEVNNQMSFLFKDLPREYLKNGVNAKTVASLGSAVGQIALYSYLFNNLYESIVGRRPAFDVIGVAEKAKNDFSNSRLAPGQAQKNLAKNISDQLPFSSVVTGGRIPIGSGLPDIYGLATGESNLKTELTKPLTYLLPPTGGGQIKKVLQGLDSINNQGVYKNGKLQNPVDTSTLNSTKGLLFGNGAFDETKDYYNNNKQPLSDKQTEMYKAANGLIPSTPKLKEDMSTAGYSNMTGKEIYNKISDERDIQKEKDKLYKLIDSLNVSDKAKAKNKESDGKVISGMKNASKADIIKKIKELQNYYKGM